jgi:hypothetical protein
MSLFRKATIQCPACQQPMEFNAVHSVNADRRPDLREAILNGSFQREPCSKCGKGFRLDPELTYIDVGRGQWIAAYPYTRLGEWRQLEAEARDTFARAYGPNSASATARKLGASLKPRLTFGWPALTEKLVADEQKLDDVTLELLKLAMLRGLENPPLALDGEMRFVRAEGEEFVMASVRSADESLIELLRVPRSLYDEIAADQTEWLPLRESLSAGLFVDVDRLIVAAV